jgi:ChrB-like protein
MMSSSEKSNGPKSHGWFLLVYRVPSEPSNNRVSVWRELKRLGALYLQQCVCVLPRRRGLRPALTQIRAKIAKLEGSSNLFELSRVTPEEEASLVAGFRDLTLQHFAEIIEECETKFYKEIEFERFRGNYTFAEAEEIASDLDKIRNWFVRVLETDWFGADGRAEVEERIQRCEKMLEDFYAEVHARSSQNVGGPDVVELGHEAPRLQVPLPSPDGDRPPDLTPVISAQSKIQRRRAKV